MVVKPKLAWYFEIRYTYYEVLIASNGCSGLEIAQKERPALILLDLLMPKFNDYEVIKVLTL